MYASSLQNTSSKPSWAFVSDGSPRSKTTMHNYRIPYPSAPNDETTEGHQFVCARAFLVLVNILFFVIGFAVIVTSIAVSAKPERCEVCHSVLNLLIAFGLISTFISALGIYGALSNSYKMLLTYVTLVAFVFMVQMVVFFWPLFGRFNFKRRMHTVYREKMRHHPQQLTELLNLLQRKFPCCGVDGPLDYHSVGLQLPLSCCSSTGGSSSGQCAAGTRPPASTTPLPGTNATEPTENTTSSSATVTSNGTAPPAMGLIQQQLSEIDTTTPEEETPLDVDEPTTETEKTSEAEKTTEAQKTSADAGGRHKEAKAAAHATEKTMNTKLKAENVPAKAEEKPEKKASINAEKTEGEVDGLSEDEYSWDEIEQEEAKTPDLAVDGSSKDRRKRSVTDAVGISSAPDEIDVMTAVTPGNISMLVYNDTELLTGNFSTNVTDEIVLDELLNNRTNLTGGPEPWDIHHVKMRGCYTELWHVADSQHGLMVAITVGAAALLSLQLMVLCTAHHVARGDFIQQG